MRRRRAFLKLGVASALAPAIGRAQGVNGDRGRVVVVGGGFAGATCARWLRKLQPRLDVTLVEPERVYTAMPLSSEVIAGLRGLLQQQFGYDGLTRAGVKVEPQAAQAVDAAARRVTLADGRTLAFDRLVMAPGIDFDWKGLPGYDEAASQKMPHAWKGGGEQITLLRRQLEAMADGGVVGIVLPENPLRCPPAPYERASLIAYYLKHAKPRSKVLILDSKDAFSQQRQFQAAWKQLYPGLIEWVPLSQAGKVTSVDVGSMTLVTDFDRHKVAVANVIPPQRAGEIARRAGVADRTGWCPVEPVAFESTLQPGVHVLGDASVLSSLAKSAFVASSSAKICAAAIVARLAGKAPADPRLVNSCYSTLAPDYGISIVGVYRVDKGQLQEVPGSGGTSPLDGDAALRAAEAQGARDWFAASTAEIFG